MDNPTRQPWTNHTPHPSTFLWAHELRRENIQLVNQIDTIRADLAAANDTIASLNRSLETLDQRAREETTKLENTLKDLEVRCDTNLRTGIERVDDLEAENRRLRNRLDVLERECHRCAREQHSMEEGIRARVLDEVREMLLERGKLGVRGAAVAACSAAGSDVLVPDSMPVGSVPGVGVGVGVGFDRRGEGLVSETLSDTTWGTPSLADEEQQCAGNGKDIEQLGVDVSGDVKQRAVTTMLKVIQDRASPRQESTKASDTPNPKVELESTNAPPVQRKRQRTRRSIPIVPADEEDERILMEMFRR
ncbi:hypothetical protein ASPBRDRAFT_38004 [Aspergillus brasiliensis CBS 101740]|uniref:Centrosomin N-terminal motif 1 domain-containing protein n=1 Tax=Aspergillus brasiliensis (strain CBS 101740 / IMI 381727 / IBT 21946) TaxID=767769 RepID=A0A1L9UVT5_ASPBC|nr:hypothetical protein ASPBRDRAFT_38004 [Aspergillus brasiliensis CBS 101740]